jgi:acyl-coenzyme A thioesterase PaaI-like protein
MDHRRDDTATFLYGPSPITVLENRLRTSVLMDDRMEGWIGIPHGGIGMGILMDLAMSLQGLRNPRYPLSAEFRLGGAPAAIGDVLSFDVAATDKGAAGEAAVHDNPLPYMTGAIRYGEDTAGAEDLFPSYMPHHAEEVLNRLSPLPSYEKCFVCGIKRNHPGLGRQFHLWDHPGKIVVSPSGFDRVDQDTFYRFQRDGLLHPLPFLALIDETLGWGGFLISASGAVTVRIRYTFHRPVSVEERLIFFGRGERVRGRQNTRLLFWASGGAAAVKSDGTLERVVSASGQWFGVQELTGQMKTALRPKELIDRVFSLSGP